LSHSHQFLVTSPKYLDDDRITEEQYNNWQYKHGKKLIVGKHRPIIGPSYVVLGTVHHNGVRHVVVEDAYVGVLETNETGTKSIIDNLG